jgi:ADP-heptose:LPS heptosyltransferase
MKLFTSGHSIENQIPKAGLDRVLIMPMGDTGSIVTLSPALRALRDALPQAELTLMTSPAGSQIVPLLPWVDHVIVDHSLGQDGQGSRSINPREEIALIERLRRHDFSIAFIFSSVSQSPMRAAFACYLAGIPYRVGFSKGLIGSMLSHTLPPADELHQVERNLSLLSPMGISGADQRMELNIPKPVEDRANELMGRAGLKLDIPYIVVAPGSMQARGEYAPDHFATVARILAAQGEIQLVIVGNSAEARTLHPVLQVAKENLYGNVFSLVEKTTVPELAAIIRQASLTIANHSVSMHLADVFGCPMVVIHSETDLVNHWKPRHSSARLLSRPAVCAKCDHVDCQHGMNCLDIRPEEVAIAALEMLSEKTYNQSDYKGIFSYKMESERNSQFSYR